MDMQTATVLLALTLFAVKHLVADFLLQTGWMYRGKGIYGHPGGLAHAGLHMLGSLPALTLLGPGLFGVLLLVLAEGVVHYHIDWTKEALTRRHAPDMMQRPFWMLLGADQFLHRLTYLALTAAALGLRA